jgi:ketosteroid isomerase-like protein
MNTRSISNTDQEQVRQILEQWAKATRTNLRDEILKYEGSEAYRRSWDDWQPDTQGEGQFDLQDLSIVAGADVAFAHCFIRCGGALPDGKTYEDLVRATFCLKKTGKTWRVEHQHISKPFKLPGGKL